MNTTFSQKKVAEFKNRKNELKRKEQTYSKSFNAKPDQIFPLLCPSRECDWIPGWDCELKYTSSGYAEQGCIFTTDESSGFHAGVWIFTEYEPNERVNIVRFQGDVVVNLKIILTDNNDGTTTCEWGFMATALNAEGNRMIESMLDQDSRIEGLFTALDHYLKTGSMLKRHAWPEMRD